MSVTVVLNQWGYGDETSHRTEWVIDDIDRIFVDCIQEQIGEGHYITFKTYYRNGDVMLYDRVFPFIKKDDSYRWYVSYKDATIREFMLTNDITDGETISVEIDQYGGRGDPIIFVIIGWIVAFYNYFDDYKKLRKCLDFVNIHFVGENRKKIDIYDVIDMVQKEIEWELDDLIDATNCKDEITLKAVLKQAGYRYRDGKFIFEKAYWEDLLNDRITIENPWEVKPVLDDYVEVAKALSDINKNITAIEYQKESDAASYYNSFRKMADKLRKKWPRIICRGKQMQYLRIRKRVKPIIDEGRWAELSEDPDDVKKQIDRLILEYDDNHRLEVEFNPKRIG